MLNFQLFLFMKFILEFNQFNFIILETFIYFLPIKLEIFFKDFFTQKLAAKKNYNKFLF